VPEKTCLNRATTARVDGDNSGAGAVELTLPAGSSSSLIEGIGPNAGERMWKP